MTRATWTSFGRADRRVRRASSLAGLALVIAGCSGSNPVPPPAGASAASPAPVGKAIDETWLAVERQVVAQTGVGFIDATAWVCPSSPCPAVIGNLLVYQNAGHLTAGFAAALTDRLGSAILGEMRPGPP
jgi:hypothetical protein